MSINLPQTRLVPGSALRTAGEEKLQRYGADSKSAIGSALREVVTPPIVEKEPRGSDKVFSVRPEVSQDTLPGSSAQTTMMPGQSTMAGAGLPGVQEAQAIIRSAIDSVIGPSRGLETTPTAMPGRSVLGPMHIGGAPEEAAIDPTTTEGKYGSTDLGNRLAEMEAGGKSAGISKKFAKLYGRFQKGGTTVTGHKTVDEMNAAGQRQAARRATEEAAVSRMNAMGRERSALAGKNVPQLVGSGGSYTEASRPEGFIGPVIPSAGEVQGASNIGNIEPSPELRAIPEVPAGGVPGGPDLGPFYQQEEEKVNAFIEQNYSGADPVFKEQMKRKILGL